MKIVDFFSAGSPYNLLWNRCWSSHFQHSVNKLSDSQCKQLLLTAPLFLRPSNSGASESARAM